jgi:hypothetical protein
LTQECEYLNSSVPAAILQEPIRHPEPGLSVKGKNYTLLQSITHGFSLQEEKGHQEASLTNPKVMLIIEEVFPRIIEAHIRNRFQPESTRAGLERYRTMGYQAIRNLPEEEMQENRDALEKAFADSIRKLEEFHSSEACARQDLVSQDSTDSS